MVKARSCCDCGKLFLDNDEECECPYCGTIDFHEWIRGAIMLKCRECGEEYPGEDEFTECPFCNDNDDDPSLTHSMLCRKCCQSFIREGIKVCPLCGGPLTKGSRL